MEYKILSSRYPSELATDVNNAIANGWKPQGGVCIQDIGASWKYYQAMVKE